MWESEFDFIRDLVVYARSRINLLRTNDRVFRKAIGVTLAEALLQ